MCQVRLNASFALYLARTETHTQARLPQVSHYIWHTQKTHMLSEIDFNTRTLFGTKRICQLRICSCLAYVYRVMDALGMFGEHENCVRLARGAAESNTSFWSALQTSQVHP